MRTHNRLGIIHAYPSPWLIEALHRDKWRVVLIGDLPDKRASAFINIEDIIHVPLWDESQVIDVVTRHHRKAPFDALLPVYEGGIVLTARLSSLLGLPCFSEASAIASRNKFIANCLWAAQRIPVPRTLPISDFTQAWALVEREFGGDAVIKLADSMNSQGVVRIRNREDCDRSIIALNEMLHGAPDIDRFDDRNRFAYGRGEVKLILQEYCDGPEVGVDVAISGADSHVLGVFEKARAEGPCFAESLSIWPTSLGKKIESELGDLAVTAVRALGVDQVVAHVEIRLTENGPKVLEAGLRPGGAYTIKATEYLTGANGYCWLAAALCRETSPKPLSPHGAALYGGVVYPRSGILTRAEGLDVFGGLDGLLDVQVLNRPGDRVYALPRSAQPHFCYYLVTGEKRADVLDKHHAIQSRIQLEVSEQSPETEAA